MSGENFPEAKTPRTAAINLSPFQRESCAPVKTVNGKTFVKKCPKKKITKDVIVPTQAMNDMPKKQTTRDFQDEDWILQMSDETKKKSIPHKGSIKSSSIKQMHKT